VQEGRDGVWIEDEGGYPNGFADGIISKGYPPFMSPMTGVF
jgi:hypothetical protein